MIALTLDGHDIEVPVGWTLLEAARDRGIPIPTLCYHEALEPFAACRMCVVELENRRGGQLVPSCAYPCEEGLIVRTSSEKVRRSRRITLELLMASAAHVPVIRALAAEFGVGDPRFRTEPDGCILCGLCVRACHEIVGVSAISLVQRGFDKKVSPPFSVASGSCIECGTCVLVCPTGAIRLADITGGRRTAHPGKPDFEASECSVCSYLSFPTRLPEPAALPAEEVIS